jgi:AraC-like DNA-binding protein
MVYLVFIVVRHSTADYLNRLPETPAAQERESAATPAMDAAQMKEISDRVTDYLQTSKAYTNPELSLAMLSVATGISTNNISRSINGYLHRNFLDFVNGMRIEEAKRLLLELNTDHTVESIYPDCGFSSDRSFFRTFKKVEGISPDMWRKNNA